MTSRPSATEQGEEIPSRLGLVAEAVAVVAAVGVGSTVAVGIGVLLSIYF